MLSDEPTIAKVKKVELPKLEGIAALLSQSFTTPQGRKGHRLSLADKRWRQRHPEQVKATSKRKWKEFSKDPEKMEMKRARDKQYREKNKEALKKKQREYWAANGARINAGKRAKRLQRSLENK